MTDASTETRRKAMAAAMRAKDEDLLHRPNWDAAHRYHELAQAADEAAQKVREEK